VGEQETFAGAGSAQWLKLHRVEVVILGDENARDLLRTFIAGNGDIWNEDIGVK
jgi:cytosine deaminase